MNGHWASLGVLILLLIMGPLYYYHEEIYHGILLYWGASYKGAPFNDLYAVMVQISCAGQGNNPYYGQENSLLCRGFNYSPALLVLSPIFPDPRFHQIAGVLGILIFCIVIQFLPLERRLRDHACMALAIFSGPVIWLLSVGNLDLFLFELTVVVSYLLTRQDWSRVVAYLLIMLVGAAKFYPIALAAHVVRERLRISGVVVVLGVIGVVAFALQFSQDLVTAIETLPRGGYFRYWWGAVVLPLGLYAVVVGVDLIGNGHTGPAPYMPYVGLVALLGWVVWRSAVFAGRSAMSDAFKALGEVHKALMISGCLIIVGCFFAWQNFVYREVFFLLILPGLLAMRDAETGKMLPVARTAVLTILALMWWDAGSILIEKVFALAGIPGQGNLFVQIVLWGIRQLLWWKTIAVLGGFLLIFISSSTSAHEARRLFPR